MTHPMQPNAGSSRVIVVQPTVPIYRTSFFEAVSQRLGSRFSVHASVQDMGVLTRRTQLPAWERALGPIRSIGPGLEWQSGALGISLERGDLVVVSGAPRCLSTLVLIAKAHWAGARVMWWGHYWSSTSRVASATLRLLIMQAADAILFYTDEEVALYGRHRWRRKGTPVFALNNGIDAADVATLRLAYDPASRTRDLLFIGRLTPKAGVSLLLEALSRPACSHLTLDVIGGGEQEAELQAQARALGLDQRVVWHGGIGEEQRIAAVANTCKLFVYPGSVGLSLIHAFAYGLPAIVHDDRWRHGPEIAAHRPDVTGWTYRFGDVASLAAALGGAFTPQGQLSAMSEAAVNITSATYNTTDMAERFCRMVDQLLSGDTPADSSPRGAVDCKL
jgi:glycosyltransferase involved in cell wall biosynthesis